MNMSQRDPKREQNINKKYKLNVLSNFVSLNTNDEADYPKQSLFCFVIRNLIRNELNEGRKNTAL